MVLTEKDPPPKRGPVLRKFAEADIPIVRAHFLINSLCGLDNTHMVPPPRIT